MSALAQEHHAAELQALELSPPLSDIAGRRIDAALPGFDEAFAQYSMLGELLFLRYPVHPEWQIDMSYGVCCREGRT